MHWRDELIAQMDGVSISELSRRSKLSRTTIQRVRNSTTPSVPVMFAICAALHGEDMEFWFTHYCCQITKEHIKNRHGKK